METDESIKNKINTQEDYIAYPRASNSINKFMEHGNWEEVDDKKIAKFLMINEEDVKKLYNSAVKKIQKILQLK